MNIVGKITKNILKTIANYPGGYAAIYNLIYDEDLARPHRNKAQNNLKNTLSRLKDKGLIINNKGIWSITQKGIKNIREQNKTLGKFFTNKNLGTKRKARNTLIVFDIPEKMRRQRNWLREELINYGFDLVQKSVWFGPPLPKDFVEYLHSHNLLHYIKFFKATGDDIT